MPYQLKYHRAILDRESGGRVLYPSGVILESLDKVDARWHDRFHYFEAPAARAEPEEQDLPELPSESEDLEG